ncbi:acyltransferase family protein [Streptomyces sp. NPDC001102]
MRTARVHRHRPALRRERPRLYAVDGIRLVAALMVAVHHYAGSRRVDQPGNAVWGRPVSEVMPTVFRLATYGWIGVEVFFVISGFVICMSCWGRGPREFFVSRVIRLYPAYWFAIVFTTAVVVALPGVWDRLRARDILLRIDDFEHVSGWRGSVVLFTGFLLVMVAIALGATDRLRWSWLATAGTLTYPLYLLHYVAGTTVINRLQGTMDARLLVATVIAGFLLLSRLVHRFVERPLARVLKRGLEGAFGRMRTPGT